MSNGCGHNDCNLLSSFYLFLVNLITVLCLNKPSLETWLWKLANVLKGQQDDMVVQSILVKVYLWGFEPLNTLHTLRKFYFSTDGYQNSTFCSLASISRRNYEKSHRLKQRSLIGQLSLRAVVSVWPNRRLERSPIARYRVSAKGKFPLQWKLSITTT